jgi:hypothetical protein
MLCVSLQCSVQATYGKRENGTLYGYGVGHHLTINLQPTEHITKAVVGFTKFKTCKGQRVLILCSLQFAVNGQTIPSFNASANCSSQSYTELLLGQSLAYLEGVVDLTACITGIGFSYYKNS